MNWGRGILIVIILFLAGMLTMVFIATKQNNDLIDDNYYEKELAFQGQIDAAKKLDAVDESSLLKQDAQTISVVLPASLATKVTDGTVIFLRSDDASKDVSVKLNPDKDGVQVLSNNKFEKGYYTARITWKNNDSLCFREEKIFVNK